MKETKALVIKTQAWEMGTVGLKKWFNNAVKFASAPILLYLAFVLGNLNNNGFQITDFIPNNVVVGGICVWLISTIQDFVRKLATDQTYIVK